MRPIRQSSAVSLLSGNTIAYNLCGIGGKDCAIWVGTPSTNRLLLLRREALELALYTFKYISGVENVVAILPPGRTVHDEHADQELCRRPTAQRPGKPIDLAVLFVRQELQPLLEQPLSRHAAGGVPADRRRDAERPRGRPRRPDHRAAGCSPSSFRAPRTAADLIVLDPLPPQ